MAPVLQTFLQSQLVPSHSNASVFVCFGPSSLMLVRKARSLLWVESRSLPLEWSLVCVCTHVGSTQKLITVFHW